MWRSLPGRVVAVLLAWQLLASALTISRGFPYYGSSMVDNAPVWELPIALWHWPAIELLSSAGYCCGLRNQLVFEAKVRGGHVTLKPFGALVLAGSSWAFWSILAIIALIFMRSRVATLSLSRAATSAAESFEESPNDEETEGGRRSESDHAGHRGHQDL